MIPYFHGRLLAIMAKEIVLTFLVFVLHYYIHTKADGVRIWIYEYLRLYESLVEKMYERPCNGHCPDLVSESALKIQRENV